LYLNNSDLGPKALEFYKYSSTGNDFILLDNRDGKCPVNDKKYWQTLCSRRLSIGADGVIFLESSEEHDYHMRYLNADGGEVSMCGNGTRALAHFYKFLTQTEKTELSFSTMNGVYHAQLDQELVWIEMTEAYDIEIVDNSQLYSDKIDSYYMNTGVPHNIYLVEDVEKVDVVTHGREIRYNEVFENGVNTNFISKVSDLSYKVRTYERGVEDETLSCGTGITACAHFLWNKGIEQGSPIKFQSRGGELVLKKEGEKVYFGGPTHMIYKGTLC
jgi:diaminopimelate epimerase